MALPAMIELIPCRRHRDTWFHWTSFLARWTDESLDLITIAIVVFVLFNGILPPCLA